MKTTAFIINGHLEYPFSEGALNASLTDKAYAFFRQTGYDHENGPPLRPLPKWQTYIGRYVITDPSAIPMITFSEFNVSIVNQKLVITIPEVRPGSFVWMKEVPLVSYGNNVFKLDGGSVGNKFITFESGNDGSMRLKWRNYVFKRQP